MRKNIVWTARVSACVLLSVSPLRAATISVPAGGNLSQAITNAQPGDTIELARGATYVGTITIRTSGDSGFPGPGGRVSPTNAGQLAIL
jgi:hypothetical protein